MKSTHRTPPRVLSLFRRRRQMGIEQVSGFLLIGGGAVMSMSPMTPSIAWVSRLWNADFLAPLMVALYVASGFALCLTERSRWPVYALLTSPVILYGALLFSYYLFHRQPFFTAGMFCALWVFMQYAHSQVQEVRAWIRP